MARKTNHQFERRKREKARQERAAARRARKRARASSRGREGGQDSDDGLDDIPVGPPPKEKISDDEVQRAIERAMNPGAGRESSRSKGSQLAGGRLFVGNLDFGTDEQGLRDLFAEGGFTVVSATLVKDRDTGRPRGFGFVELAGPEEAQKAIDAFDGFMFSGRPLRVNPADRPPGR